MNPWGGSAAGYGEAQNRVGNVNQGQARPVQARTVKCYNCNGCQDNAFDDDVDEQPVQDLTLNVDNVFQAEDYDAFDSDVDEAPTAQTMFMANLSSADPITDEAGPSYDSDILSEVQDHDQYLDDTCTYHEEHEMHDSVQLDHGVDLHANYTSVSNMIPYDQYVKDNEVPVVHSNASYVPNDTFMMIYNDMCEPSAPSVSNTSRNAAVKTSLTAELATYKEQVELPPYNDLNKVAIGYKNPLYLTRANQAQPALYNGREILKDNHAPAKVHNTEDTLKLSEITRKKMNAKMTDPECVTHKRITPTAITDGERGFEQTKACYLQEVIPFFKTIKDNFEGIQKALTKEVKEMKDVFEELEAEVAQCAVDMKHDAIDRKNLLIANDNLIAECLSKEVISVATKSELNVARFAEMHVANTSAEARCLALEAELATLGDKSHQENQGELIKHFSKLEVDHLNLQLKYQNLKDSIGNNPPTPDKDTSDFDSVFVIGKMQASLQEKDNAIRQLKKQLSKLQVTSSDTERTIKVRTIDSQLTKVTDPVTNLQAHNDLFRAENDKVKQHYKELYDSIKITRAKHIEQVTKLTAKNMMLKTSVSKAKVQPLVLTRTKHAVDVEPIVPRLRNNRDAHLDYLRHLKESVETIRDIIKEAKVPKSNPKTNRISSAKGANKLPVEDLPRMNKSHLRTTNHVDSSSRIKRTQVNLFKRPCTRNETPLTLSWEQISRLDSGVRDTIQRETVVSTISQEYLLEFTSEYGISEDLHHELPGPEKRIVDFPEDMDLFNLISAPNPSKVKTGLRPCAAHEVPLLMATASRVIDMEDPNVATESSGTPTSIEKSPLDFDNENPSPPITEVKGATSEVSLKEEVAAMRPRLSKKRRRRVTDGADANAPPKVLREDYASVRPKLSTHGGKTLPTMGLAADSTFVTSADTKGVSDPIPLSYAEPQPHPEQSMTQSFEILIGNVATMKVQDTHFAKVQGQGNRPPPHPWLGHLEVAMGSQLRPRFEQEVRLLKKARAQIARRDQRIQVREEEIKKLDQEVQGLQNQTSNLKTLLEAEADMKKAAEAKNVDLTKELESLRTQFLDLQVSNDQRCTEMDARLDALSIDFDEKLYPYMLTAIAGHQWVIGHDLRLAVMKCAESIELRQAFANVVSAGIAKGISEGLTHGIEHGNAGRDLELEGLKDATMKVIMTSLHLDSELKDLKYPIVDQLEGLKDASMEVIMTSLHLESDSGEDAPKWICDLFPSTSQLKIPVYPKVRDPKDPWAVKEEMLLEEAIAANVSRAEKKKRCRVVCRTHEVGFAHHARSDGVPVSVPTVAPQSPAILLVDPATQTKTSKDDASPRLLRSKSLPPMYNLDWP
nr:transposase (putative), gypsy type [Tanacetum cinerariifolium]